MSDNEHWVASASTKRREARAAHTIVRTVERQLEQDSGTTNLVFDRPTGRLVDLDLLGTEADVADRYRIDAPLPSAEARERGRPKLSVVSREGILLPRHWNCLAEQEGGVSSMGRRIVDAAIKVRQGLERARRATEAGSRFMSAIFGDLPNLEEASRALFAADHAAFQTRTAGWSADLRDELDRFHRDANGADA